MASGLMQDIHAFRPPSGTLAVWWLGQMGYVFKSPEGATLGVDLYLTDSCATLEADLDLRRRKPVLIEPEDLDLHLFACTHNHQDHTDPATLRRLTRRHTMRFLGPPPSCALFRAEGIPEDRITVMWPDAEFRFHDLALRATFALPTDSTDFNHLGYVIRIGDGPTIYLTGDTAWHPLLAEAPRCRPDVLITCVNGGFGNLNHWEAAGRVHHARADPALSPGRGLHNHRRGGRAGCRASTQGRHPLPLRFVPGQRSRSAPVPRRAGCARPWRPLSGARARQGLALSVNRTPAR